MLKVINNATQALATTGAPANGAGISLNRVWTFSAQCNVTVNTPAAKTFASTAVNTGTNAVTITAHGFPTGLVGQLTTTGALPTGLSTSTNYFIIVVDANTVKFASSLANAQAGTAITLSAQGSGNDTFTPTALASGSVKLQKSNDGTNWLDEVAGTGDTVTGTITATGSIFLQKTMPAAAQMRLAFTLASGSYSSSSVILTQGDLP